MTQVTAEMVKQLRDRTGVGMGKCKKALDEASGDMEAAIDILRKAGIASAVKKESRETKEGMIGVAENDQAVAIVEINAETDFVVQNERFKELVKVICQAALTANTSDIDSLCSQKTNSGQTVEEIRAENVQALGENIRIKRVKILSKASDTSIGVYSHMGGKIVSVVEIAGANDVQDLAKELAMHVAAEAPEYLTSEEIPADVKAREEDIAREQVKNKPDNIIDKIVQGKLNAFYDQFCLLRQKFVKDSSVSVQAYVAAQGKDLGKSLSVKSFTRWQIGE